MNEKVSEWKKNLSEKKERKKEKKKEALYKSNWKIVNT